MSSSSVPADPRSRIVVYRWTVGLFLLLFTAFRFWYSGHVELVQDEAYYWQWSRHPAFGFYDNTPLMAFVIRFFTSPSLFGATEIGVRAGAVLSSVIVSLFIYLTARKLLDEKTALICVAVANLIPLYSAGAILMTQDPVHVAFWSITLYVAWTAAQQRSGLGAWGWWLSAGLFAGLTTMAKLNGCMILVGILLYVCLTPDARRWLRHPAPYAAVALCILVFLPFLLWNHDHGNAFWHHSQAMASRGADQAKTLRWTGEFLGAQAILLSPLLFFTYLYTLRYPRLDDEPDQATRPLTYLWCNSAIVFVVIVLQTFHGRVEGNWSVSSYVSGIILVGRLIVVCRGRARIWHLAGIALAVLMTAIVYFPAIGYALGLRLKTDRTTDLHGWRSLAKRVSAEQAALGGPGKSFVCATDYELPSELAFYLPGQPATYSLYLHDRRNEYMFWSDPNKLIGENAIFANQSETPDHDDDCRSVFKKVILEPPFKYYRWPYTSPVRTIQIYRCYGFKGYNPQVWVQGW